MDELYEEQREKYNKKKGNAIEMCKKYIEENNPKYEERTIPNIVQGKYSIPITTKHPTYVCYNSFNKSVYTEDDPTLRFIPYIKDNKEYSDIAYYDSTTLQKPPISFKGEIYKKMAKAIFYEFPDKELFELCNFIRENKKINREVREYFSIIFEFAEYSKMSLLEIMEFWEKNFDKDPHQLYHNKNEMSDYFCNVCYIFECPLHPNVKSNVEKR